MKNDITINDDGSINTVVTYSQDDIQKMKDASDAKIAAMKTQIDQESSILAGYRNDLALEQENNDKIASWLDQSATAVATAMRASPPIQAN